MAKTVIGLMDSRDQAQEVVDELQKSGFSRQDVSIVSGKAEGDARPVVMKDMGKGALVGGIVGLLAGAAALMIPGIGWVMVAGPLATLLASAAAGTLAGGMIGALTSKGIPEEDAHFYAEGLRRGGTLVMVHAKSDRLASVAEQVMKRHGAIDIEERREQWKQQGWSGRFDGKAPITPQEQAEPELAPRYEGAAAPLAAVCVYALEIEDYLGPERRSGRGAYSGTDRRKAAA
jgi:hypothetical protein